MSQSPRLMKQAASTWLRPRLAAKVAIALGACLALRIALAQGPAGPTVIQDEKTGFSVQQPYEKWLGTKNKGAETTARTAVRQMLAGQAPFDALKFDFFYKMYYFPLMTQATDEALKTLPEERQRFFRDHLEYSGRTPQAHAALISLALPEMANIVGGNFHPAVRYNAMLIISGLNDVEPSRTVQPISTPEPMQRALPIILGIYKKCVKPEDDAVRLAALLGMSRHLEWDVFRNNGAPPAIQANVRKEVLDELLKLATLKQTPADRDADGHVWFRRRAVEALGCSCAKTADPQIVSTLEGMLKDEKEPLSLRLTVATTLGKMSLKDPAKIDPKATATELGYLALVVCDTELSRLANLKKTEEEHMIRLSGQLPGEFGGSGIGPGNNGPRGENFIRPSGGIGPGPGSAGVRPAMPLPGGPGAGAFGGEGGTVDPSTIDPKHYRFEYARRRLRQQLYCVQLGLLGGDDFKPTPAGAKTGSGPAPPPPSTYGVRAISGTPEVKTYVEDVYTKVRDMVDIVENRTADTPSLDKELRRKMKPLEDITRKLAPPAAATAAAAAAAAADDDDLLNPGGAKPAPMPPTTPAPMAPAGTTPAPPPAGTTPPPAGTPPAPPPATTPPAKAP